MAPTMSCLIKRPFITICICANSRGKRYYVHNIKGIEGLPLLINLLKKLKKNRHREEMSNIEKIRAMRSVRKEKSLTPKNNKSMERNKS